MKLKNDKQWRELPAWARIANPRQRGVYVLRISNGNNLYIKRFARF
jgi:hypothetical protein